MLNLLFVVGHEKEHIVVTKSVNVKFICISGLRLNCGNDIDTEFFYRSALFKLDLVGNCGENVIFVNEANLHSLSARLT